MTSVHPTAVVDKAAELADGVRIGPFCIVEAEVQIGEGTVLEGHAVVRSGTNLGKQNVLAYGAVLGGDPQDRKYQGERTYLRVGDHNVFREFVTVHRATGEGLSTTVGNHCYLMAYCHLGHNVTLHDWVTMANSTGVSGHVTMEELVNIGGMVGIHQWVRIGKAAMVGGYTRLTRDVPPFMIVSGDNEEVRDINAVGLRRLGLTAERRLALHKACKLLFKSRLGLTNAMEIVRREVPCTEEVEYVLAFEQRRFLGKNGRGDQR